MTSGIQVDLNRSAQKTSLTFTLPHFTSCAATPPFLILCHWIIMAKSTGLIELKKVIQWSLAEELSKSMWTIPFRAVERPEPGTGLFIDNSLTPIFSFSFLSSAGAAKEQLTCIYLDWAIYGFIDNRVTTYVLWLLRDLRSTWIRMVFFFFPTADSNHKSGPPQIPAWIKPTEW